MRRGATRRGRALFKKLIEAAAVILAFACIVVGVTVTSAARVSEPAGFAARRAREQSAKLVSDSRAELTASLTFVPSPGATSVQPDAPIVVNAGKGHLTAVRVTSSSGAVVAGTVTASEYGWQWNGFLAYGTVYRVTATVSGAARTSAESTMSFRTIAPPATTVTASVFPNDGLSVGVGQPIAFRFSRAISDAAARASLLRHLSVTESRPIAGGWYWFSDRELHFRPKAFWPAGDRVTVVWNLTGWNAGDGARGDGQGAVRFAAGVARVSYANLATHVMTVTVNGRTIATYPISGGKPTDPTMAGVHIVLDRESVVRMNSATNGIPVNSPDGYDELVYDDVHISDTGEYVHAAPWSVASQGRMNVSHGCINLSPANARAFFAFSRVGDVVFVTGSPRPPVVGDHGVMDWDTSWAAFTPAGVVGPSSSGAGAHAVRE